MIIIIGKHSGRLEHLLRAYILIHRQEAEGETGPGVDFRNLEAHPSGTPRPTKPKS